MKFKAENGNTLTAKDAVQASAFINAGMVPADAAAKEFKNGGKITEQEQEATE